MLYLLGKKGLQMCLRPKTLRCRIQGAHLITQVFQSRRTSPPTSERDGKRQKKFECERESAFLALKTEEGGHKPRNVGSLSKVGMEKKQIFPWSFYREEGSPADTLILPQ